jgi:hypothetical protein
MSTTIMHGCQVIVGNWDIDLGRGRRLQRGRYVTFDWEAVEYVDESMAELLMETNRAFAVLNAPGHNLDAWGSEVSTWSLEDSASFSSGYLSTLSDFSVDTPSTVYSPLPNNGGSKHAGWRHFSGKSRAPSPWPGRQIHHASTSCVGRFMRAVKVQTGKIGFAARVVRERLRQIEFGKGKKAA